MRRIVAIILTCWRPRCLSRSVTSWAVAIGPTTYGRRFLSSGNSIGPKAHEQSETIRSPGAGSPSAVLGLSVSSGRQRRRRAETPSLRPRSARLRVILTASEYWRDTLGENQLAPGRDGVLANVRITLRLVDRADQVSTFSAASRSLADRGSRSRSESSA